MLGNNCSHKLPQQPLASSVPSSGTDGHHPAFGLRAPRGCTSQRARTLFLSRLPAPGSRLSRVPFRFSQGTARFRGRRLVWAGGSWWIPAAEARGEGRTGSPRPCAGPRSSPREPAEPGGVAQLAGLRVVQPEPRGKSTRLEQRGIAIGLNST